jgi:hypothetical protein
MALHVPVFEDLLQGSTVVGAPAGPDSVAWQLEDMARGQARMATRLEEIGATVDRMAHHLMPPRPAIGDGSFRVRPWDSKGAEGVRARERGGSGARERGLGRERVRTPPADRRSRRDRSWPQLVYSPSSLPSRCADRSSRGRRCGLRERSRGLYLRDYSAGGRGHRGHEHRRGALSLPPCAPSSPPRVSSYAASVRR